MNEGRLEGISVRVTSAPKGLKIWKEIIKKTLKVQGLFWTLKGTEKHLAYLFFVLLCVGIGSITSQIVAVKQSGIFCHEPRLIHSKTWKTKNEKARSQVCQMPMTPEGKIIGKGPEPSLFCSHS